MVSWTKEQQLAIDAKGNDILVAAAAGSGKTAVLVERIIQKLLDEKEPVNIDELLVVTFTNAAAQEMRSRVGQALEKALQQDPASGHLKKQLSLLQTASISTLHSFCLDVVRKYAYLLDIDPGFRIADDLEADMIRQEVMSDLLEAWYGTEGAEQEAFFSVVDRFSNDRNDLEVEDLLLKLYDFSTQNPSPDYWLEQMADLYAVDETTAEADISWLAILKREAADQLSAMLTEADLALSIIREPEGPSQYAETIAADRALIAAALEHAAGPWNTMQAFLAEQRFGKLPSKKADCDENKKERVKKLRDSYKKRWSQLSEDWYSRKLESYLEDMHGLYPAIQQLALLVKQFRASYQEQKRERALVDFADLEHFCLQVLTSEDSTAEQIIPSEVALGYQQKFKEILVDEYQDTNLVQETLVTLLSDRSGAGNMFMVGDVKQSIYRFRHAEPTLFLEKYKAFQDENHPGLRIDLASNFRSRKQVLDGANYIFRQLFSEDVGEMNYEKEAELIYANKLYDELTSEDMDAELLVIDREAKEEPEHEAGEQAEDLEKAQLEARAYGELIQRWIGHEEGTTPLQVVDKATGNKRDVQYRDIVILLRSMTWAPSITEELKRQGIPVYAELATGYLEAIEIKVMMSVLKIIDNPLQDIPLASVLRSPIIGLTEDELAQIRLADNKNSYYEALKTFCRQNQTAVAEKAERLLSWLKEWRQKARQGALSDLIWQVMQTTGYYDFVGGIPGGRQRQANLRSLYDRARNYEKTSFRGLFRFVKFIERMEERGEDLGTAKALGEQEDVVRIMTIHKSKGLEFPVVITGAMDKQFNQQDLRQRYLLHKDIGFGSKFINPAQRLMYPTLIYHALKAEKQRELLAEEMRVLYVALTRAKEKLVMVGNVASLAKKKDLWQQAADHGEWVLPAYQRLEAKSYLDWVAPALIRHEQAAVLRAADLSADIPEAIRQDASEWRIQLLDSSYYQGRTVEEEQQNERIGHAVSRWEPLADEAADLREEVEHRLAYSYPYKEASRFRAKQTVTEIKRLQEARDEYSSDQLIHTMHNRPPITRRPRFLQQQKKLTPAEIGSAMHTVMQNISFSDKWTSEKLDDYLVNLIDRELLTQEAADAIRKEQILAFFETELAQRIRSSSTYYRETPFSLALEAEDLYQDWSGADADRVVVQGVIDGILQEEDGLILIDYKSDAIYGDDPAARADRLARRYKVQVDLYAKAIEQIWKQPVKEKYLYFFDGTILKRM